MIAQIGYGFILTPVDFPNYDTTLNYDEWETEVRESGYLHILGIDKDSFFLGITYYETDDFDEIDFNIFYQGDRRWVDCLNTFNKLFPNFHYSPSWFLIQGE